MTNHTFTAEDFEQARFAEHELGSVAARALPGSHRPWVLTAGLRSDDHMAANGWSPVREANGRRDRNTNIDHIQEQDRIIRDRNKRVAGLEDAVKRSAKHAEDLTRERDKLQNIVKAVRVDPLREELVDLRQENDRLERILQAPLSLKDLQVAWENAEQADECRKGDVLIWVDNFEHYSIYPAVSDAPLITARILSRAPRREPWAELADVLGRYDLSAIECEGAGELARDLYADGVRVVTGGDEK